MKKKNYRMDFLVAQFSDGIVNLKEGENFLNVKEKMFQC
jgi:hypothetical protein